MKKLAYFWIEGYKSYSKQQKIISDHALKYFLETNGQLTSR